VACVVPNVRGLTLAAARTAIHAGHCAVGTVKRLASNTVPSGKVISQTPAPGRYVRAGSKVNLKVSRGTH